MAKESCEPWQDRFLQSFEKQNSKSRAKTSLEALVKQIYSNLFDWMVVKLNVYLNPDKKNLSSEQYTIGLLDIFGFENFSENPNSLEQLCINYTNEKLQGLYLTFVFERQKTFLGDKEGVGVGGKDSSWINQNIVFESNDIKILTCEIIFDWCAHITVESEKIDNDPKWVTEFNK